MNLSCESVSIERLASLTHPCESSEANTASNLQNGRLIVNADDWGRDPATTTQIADCVSKHAVSSVSAMVFMCDSARAAALARDSDIDAGLHLNLTTPFSGPCPVPLLQRQQELSRFLRRHPAARLIYHPGLARAFEYVVSAQIAEFQRLYDRLPDRIDGHHHMHLSANVLLGGLLPAQTNVRPHFSREAGEKFLRNRLFRRFVHRKLAARHRTVDFFFTLPPLQRSRLDRIFALSRRFVVEIETHPAMPDEYQFLMSGDIFSLLGSVSIADRFAESAATAVR